LSFFLQLNPNVSPRAAVEYPPSSFHFLERRLPGGVHRPARSLFIKNEPAVLGGLVRF